VVYACYPKYSEGEGRRNSRIAWAKLARPHLKNKIQARCQWYMSVILATWEAAIRRIAV
jgi:hypothetical protein